MKDRTKQNAVWFWLGILLTALTLVPNLILGQDAIFTYHDQLDGEMIAYMLQARHLFSGDSLPEFMGGMPKTALIPPAPAFVLLFLGGSPFAALTAMQLAGRLTGFIGMCLLSREVTEDWLAAAVAGGLYALLPFLPVYGLSQYGIPLLFWCGLQIKRGKHLKASYCYVVVFALSSSLVLVGFGLLGMGMLALAGELWQYRRKREGKSRTLRVLAAWLVLLGIYIAENFRLLGQMLGMGDAMVSHKAEYALSGRAFWPAFWQYLLKGGQYSEGYQQLLVPVMLITVLAGILLSRSSGRRTEGEKAGRGLRWMGACLGWILLSALTAAFWNSEAGVALRDFLGAGQAWRSFQLDRVLWMTPCLWYLAAAGGWAFLRCLWEQHREKGKRLVLGGLTAVWAAAVGITAVQILLAGDIKSNVQKLRNPDYGLLSYNDYYAVGVMEQVRDFLAEETGKGQEEYRVVSLGIDPAAALYHGFYCLDGYSNNYSLDYKHRFREIIEPELEKSDYLQAYFDDWGNRCYLFSAECPGYYTIEKGGFYFQDFQLNMKALRENGCDYLLSAAYIQNADREGLVLMNETPFEAEDSYYQIYVYQVGD